MTEYQMDVWRLIALGYNNAAIVTELGKTKRGIEACIERVYAYLEDEYPELMLDECCVRRVVASLIYYRVVLGMLYLGAATTGHAAIVGVGLGDAGGKQG